MANPDASICSGKPIEETYIAGETQKQACDIYAMKDFTLCIASSAPLSPNFSDQKSPMSSHPPRTSP